MPGVCGTGRVLPHVLGGVAMMLLSACGESTRPGGGDLHAPGDIEIVEGQSQRGRVGAPLSQPLKVRVRDASGAPIVGARVRWTPIDSTDGMADPAESRTIDGGFATTNWILGTRAEQRLVAHLGGPPRAEFHALADGFTLVCTPSATSHSPGQVRATSCTVTSVGDFTGSVTLSAAAVPVGFEVGFGTATLNLPTASSQAGTTVQLGVGGSVAAGTYQVVINATSGEDSMQFTFQVTVL